MMNPNLLSQMRLRRLLGIDDLEDPNRPDPIMAPASALAVSNSHQLPSDTSDETDIADLYEDPESLKTYRQHVQNAPLRENHAPSGTDRFLSFAMGLSDGPDAMKLAAGIRDQKYNTAREKYETVGEGLQSAAGLDLRSQGNRRSAFTARESARDRRENQRSMRQDRNIDNTRQYEQLDETKRHNQATEENDRLRATGQAEKDDNEQIFAYDSDVNQNLPVTKKEARDRKLEKPIGDTHIAKEAFYRNVETMAIRLHELVKKHTSATGGIFGVQGALTRGRNASGISMLSDPELQEMQNLMQALTAERLREQAGSALTPTELEVYKPILPNMSLADDINLTNLNEIAKASQAKMRRRTHGRLPGEESKDPPIPGGGSGGGVSNSQQPKKVGNRFTWLG